MAKKADSQVRLSLRKEMLRELSGKELRSVAGASGVEDGGGVRPERGNLTVTYPPPA